MKTFDEAVEWARGKYAEAQKISNDYVPAHANKRKPAKPAPTVTPTKPTEKST